MLSENVTIEEFVNRHWVKKVPQYDSVDITDELEEIALLQKAGFYEVAKIKSIELTIIDSQNRRNKKLRELQGRILLKKPEFKDHTINHYGKKPWLLLPILAILISIGFIDLFFVLPVLLLLGMGILTFSNGDFFEFEVTKFSGVSLGKSWLVSVPLNNYTGHVPRSLAQKVVDVKKEYSDLRVWFISKRNEIPNLVKGERVIAFDPLLVAYERDLRDYVVLLAIWGEDIMDLDSYFSQTSRGRE